MYPIVFSHATDCRLAIELAALRRYGLHVRIFSAGDRRGLSEALADAVLLWRVPGGVAVSANVLAQAPRLRLIQALGSAAEAIDLAAAKARGIAVCVAAGADTAAVAEMVLALTLACLRRLPELDRASRAGLLWLAEGGSAFGELGGRTIGLVGYGPVPARLAPVLKALGAAAVLYWHGQRERGA